MKDTTEIPIIYVDENILVVNKPAGISVHGDGKTSEKTLADWVLSKYPEMANVGEPAILSNGQTVDKPGIVHRLDKETSGVLVLAKNQKSFLSLKKQFKDRKVQKEYNAFIYGHMPNKFGTIDLPIGRSKSDFRKKSTKNSARGDLREAQTYFETIASDEKTSYLKLQPKTGRTHQIRVHLSAVGHPVVCDKLYAKGRESLLGFQRLALHARSITLSTQNGEVRTFNAPYPDDFLHAQGVFGLKG